MKRFVFNVQAELLCCSSSSALHQPFGAADCTTARSTTGKYLPESLPNIQAPSQNLKDKGRIRSADLQEVENIPNAQHSTTN